MSSESGKKSMDELVQQARQQAQTAGKVIPCVTVTETNWAALLKLEQLQLQLLQAEGKQLEALATEDQLVDYMNRQLEILRKEGKNAREDALQFREDLLLGMQKFSSQMEKTSGELSKQAGSMSEAFGNALLQEQQRMRKFTGKAFWISLIPTAITLVWCLAQRIWFPM